MHLLTFISLLSILVAASPAPATSGLPCTPIALYRKRSKNPVNGEVAYMDTTDISEASSTFILDRQIASICSKQASGTVPIYRGFNSAKNVYLTTILLDGQDFAGYKVGSPLGYVYTSQNQKAPTQMYRNYKPGTSSRPTKYLTTNIKTEGVNRGYKSFSIFWTLPLGPDTGLPCNPIALYRKRSKNPVNGAISHMDTTVISEASSAFILDKKIASICSKPAAGSVPLYRGFNPDTKVYYTGVSLDGRGFAGFKLGSPLGYVYFTQNQVAPTQIYRNYKRNSNTGITSYLTTIEKTEGVDLGYKSFPAFWALPSSATN